MFLKHFQRTNLLQVVLGWGWKVPNLDWDRQLVQAELNNIVWQKCLNKNIFLLTINLPLYLQTLTWRCQKKNQRSYQYLCHLSLLWRGKKNIDSEYWSYICTIHNVWLVSMYVNKPPQYLHLCFLTRNWPMV